MNHTTIQNRGLTTRLAGAGTALVLAAGALTLTGGPALAKDGDVQRSGSCSGGTSWKLKASPEDGRIEVEGEVDSNKNGQKWRWRLMHNDSRSARGKATTKPPSGSFEVRRVVVDLKGTDKLTFVARHPKSGEVCRGTVKF
jgi:hypothetical protein